MCQKQTLDLQPMCFALEFANSTIVGFLGKARLHSLPYATPHFASTFSVHVGAHLLPQLGRFY